MDRGVRKAKAEATFPAPPPARSRTIFRPKDPAEPSRGAYWVAALAPAAAGRTRASTRCPSSLIVTR